MLASSPPPPYMWIWFPLIFAGAWCLAGWLVSVMSGWGRLAKVYPARQKPEGRRFAWQSGKMGWGNYNNCLIVHTSPEGISLSMMAAFRLGHPPIFIPWGEVRNCSATKVLWVKMVQFDVGFPAAATVRLRREVFEGYEDMVGLTND